MNLKNRPPVFVPDHFQGEMEKLSKACLMDMVWDLARCAAGVDDLQIPAIMAEIRNTARIINSYRQQEKPRLKGRYLAKEEE